jgi:hypothetical protein
VSEGLNALIYLIVLLSLATLKAWRNRSGQLKFFETLSLQLERLAALQTTVLSDLTTAMEDKLRSGTAEMRALFSDVTSRLSDLQSINDLWVRNT